MTQQPFIPLVDQILAAKKKDPNADTSALEKQIDEMVYKLYDPHAGRDCDCGEKRVKLVKIDIQYGEYRNAYHKNK